MTNNIIAVKIGTYTTMLYPIEAVSPYVASKRIITVISPVIFHHKWVSHGFFIVVLSDYHTPIYLYKK